MENTVETILKKYPTVQREILIPILQEIQETEGYISEQSIADIARHLSLPTSKIYGLTTFYNQFRFTKKGRYHFQVCHGSSCHLAGTEKLISEMEKQLGIKNGEVSRDKLFSLEVLPCIGACGQSPVIAVNDEYFAKVDSAKLKEIIDNCKKG